MLFGVHVSDSTLKYLVTGCNFMLQNYQDIDLLSKNGE